MNSTTSIFDRIESHSMCNDEYSLIPCESLAAKLMDRRVCACRICNGERCFDCLVMGSILTLQGMDDYLRGMHEAQVALRRELVGTVLARAMVDAEVLSLKTLENVRLLTE